MADLRLERLNRETFPFLFPPFHHTGDAPRRLRTRLHARAPTPLSSSPLGLRLSDCGLSATLLLLATYDFPAVAVSNGGLFRV